MPTRLVMDRLDRITLVRKGKAVAKHPDLRTGVIDVVKSEDDWYVQFAGFIQSTADEDIPEDWVEAFAALPEQVQKSLISAPVSSADPVEKAKKKNYPDTAGPFAGPHNSFPISSQAHVYAAAKLIGHAANPAAVKAAVIRIARSKGYSLPKSWTKTVKKSDIQDFFKALIGALPDEVEVDKAKADTHAHTHSHVSQYGYGSYEHNHDHAHGDGVTPDSKDHDSSEIAHAHAHVSKAGEPVTEEEAKNLEADNAGLKKELDEAKVAREAADAKVVAVEAEVKDVEEKLEAVEKALKVIQDEKAEAVKKADAEAVKAKEAVEKAVKLEADLVEASRKPAVVAPVTKAAGQNIKDMNFDDAFKAVLHG